VGKKISPAVCLSILFYYLPRGRGAPHTDIENYAKAYKVIGKLMSGRKGKSWARCKIKKTSAFTSRDALGLEDPAKVLEKLLLFDELQFDKLTIAQMNGLAIALGEDQPPKGGRQKKLAILRPLFDKYVEKESLNDMEQVES
jgi:hypothetical protein